MPPSVGDKLGPYEILAHLGKGGMGEVFRAHDPRTGRDVAIKVAGERFNERFDREVRAVAALNHPNICHLYDVGPNYLVMELVEGEQPKGPLPLDTATGYARQLVAALEEAHDKGITHRDLKPANIKITHDGTVKVLDFGLAKVAAPSSAGDPENSPTLSMMATQTGVILGTAAYMPPEQAKGKPADRRADIWAFGVVFYELLTGKQLFQGETIGDVLAAVIREEPDLKAVPPAVRGLIARCLQKDPKRRLQAIGEARLMLDEGALGETAAGRGPLKTLKPALMWGAMGALAMALAALAILHFREAPPERQVLQYSLSGPDKARTIQQFAVSPDGHYVVMRASGDAGSQLWVRSMDSLQAQPLMGTENAQYPFWSPDSRYIGFFSDNKLRKVAVNGGPAQPLCDAGSAPRGGAWSSEGVILFGNGFAGTGIKQVPEAGGVPSPATKTGAGANRNPVFLPDGRHFLYASTGITSQNGIFLASLDSQETRRLLPDESAPQYFNGHILFVRAGTLMAQPVDPKTFQTKGNPFPVAPDQISAGFNPSDFLYSVSANGILVYQGGGAGTGRQHLWFDRTGKEVGSAGGPMRSGNSIALSPDGKKLAIERASDQGGNGDLWTIDMEHSNTESRFTFAESISIRPVWSPDSTKIAFASSRQGFLKMFVRAYGIGQDELLFDSKEPADPTDWSRDGKFIIFRSQNDKTQDDLWALPLTGDKKPLVAVQTPFRETQGQLSPDGRWLAYTSNESGGRFEVLVQPFAPGFDKPVKGKWQISTVGGMQPRWRPDGKELFYVTTDRKLMAADIKETAQSFDHGTPHVLFDWRGDATSVTNFGYAVSPDGKRFLIAAAPGALAQAPPLTVVVNWLGAVKK